MKTKEQKRNTLKREWIAVRNCSEYEQHKWFCHPEMECDGCSEHAIPERVSIAMQIELSI